MTEGLNSYHISGIGNINLPVYEKVGSQECTKLYFVWIKIFYLKYVVSQ